MRILFVAYYFAPESSSGSFRPLYFANHLRRIGCEINVLTGSEECYLPEQPTDDSLLNILNSDIKITRTRVSRPREALINLKNKLFFSPSKPKSSGFSSAETSMATEVKSTFQLVKDFITDLLAMPDPHIGWLPWAVWKGRKIIKSSEIDVIWATGSPWTCFLVGVLLKKISGKPLVLDYRDPWGSNPNLQLKNTFIAGLEKKLERLVVGNADLITANTIELKDNFLHRFPFLRENQITTIPNGFEEFALPSFCKNDAFTLTHAGAIYFSRNPINLLLAVHDLLESGLIAEGEIKINFVGGISIDDPALHALLSSSILKGVVTIYPRVAIAKAVEYQMNSDVLFLLQPGFPLQIPRKLYEYVSLRKPILAITDPKGATANIIEENEFGKVVADSVDDLKSVLYEMWLKWREGGLAQPPLVRGALFLNSNISKTLYRSLAALVDGKLNDTSR